MKIEPALLRRVEERGAFASNASTSGFRATVRTLARTSRRKPLVLGGETEDDARFQAGRKPPNDYWDRASSDVSAAALADATGAVVVSVGYRLAPEHPFPAGPDDCEWAARWLIEHAQAEWGVTTLSLVGRLGGRPLGGACPSPPS